MFAKFEGKSHSWPQITQKALSHSLKVTRVVSTLKGLTRYFVPGQRTLQSIWEMSGFACRMKLVPLNYPKLPGHRMLPYFFSVNQIKGVATQYLMKVSTRSMACLGKCLYSTYVAICQSFFIDNGSALAKSRDPQTPPALVRVPFTVVRNVRLTKPKYLPT